MKTKRFAFATLLLFIAASVSPALGATYTFTRGSEVHNNWNESGNWTPSGFPNAAGDIAYSWANYADTHILLNQDITIGSLSWYGYQLFIEPGSPAGKLIVNDGGTLSVWTNILHYGFEINCDLVLDSDVTLHHENDVWGNGWWGQLNGQITSTGKLSVAWYGGGNARFSFGGTISNTYSGGTELDSGRADSIFRANKNGAFGLGDVTMTDDAVLELTDRGGTDDMIYDGAALRLNQSGLSRSSVTLFDHVSETVRALYINGAQYPAGTYGSHSSSADTFVNRTQDRFFSGSGVLVVLEGGDPAPCVQFTNETSGAVTVSDTSVYLAGTNNEYTAAMWWRNETTDNSGVLTPDPAGWSFTAADLAMGPNVITVYGSNSVGVVLEDSIVVTAVMAPTISNEVPYSVQVSTVRARGYLTATNFSPTTVYLFHGTTDGGTAEIDWEFVENLGVKPIGRLDQLLTNIVGSSYYYRYCASNFAGVSWCNATTVFTPETPFDGPAGYTMAITITFNGYSPENLLADYPALIKLNESIPDFLYSQFKSDSNDIRFVAADGSLLSYNIEAWDPSGDSFIWVRVPVLASNTMIKMYYSKPGDTAPTDGVNTWDDRFASVWHMGNDNLRDATANAKDASNGSGDAASINTNGLIGSGSGFYNAQYVTIPAVFSGASKCTFSTWLNLPSAPGEYDTVLDSPWGDGLIIDFRLQPALIFNSFGWFGWGYDFGSGDWNQWRLLTVSYDQEAVTAKFYVDGQLKNSGGGTANALAQAGPGRLGCLLDNGNLIRFLDGIMDEVRLSLDVRSADWTWADWKNQSAPFAFASYSVAPISTIPAYVDITNVTGVIAVKGLTSYVIAGTNNENTVGDIIWTNKLNGSNGVVSASSGNWSFSVGLNEGDNVIKVSGTNIENVISYDQVTIGVVQLDVANRSATVVAFDKATANAWLYNSAPSVPAAMYVCYGTTDRGTDVGAWDHVVLVSANQAAGSVSKQLTGLSGSTPYFYTFFASNSLEVLFADNGSETFTTTGTPEIETAGDLLVNVRVGDLAVGTVSSWPNKGTLGSAFAAFNDPFKEANAASTLQSGVRFDWDAFTGPTAPDSITSTNDRSIEVWAYNYERYTEPKTMVELGCRDKAEGQSFAFSWGENWLLEGWGWGNAFWVAGSPAANQWRHLVLTYDGQYLKVYDNGVLDTTVDYGSPGLDTFPGLPITLGSQLDGDGNVFVDWWASFNGFMSTVRIHDGVLTAEQVLYNYKAGMTPLAPHSVTKTATDVTTTSVSLNGELLSVGAGGGGDPDVYVCYGTAVGGTSTSDWSYCEFVGNQAVGTFSKNVTVPSGGLYYYSFYAVNLAGATWSDMPDSVGVPSVPSIVNEAPKSVRVSSARACGNLVATNFAPTTVKLYYGTTDGVADPGAWETEVDLGILPQGEIEYLITGMTEPTYYRYYATNVAGEAWCSSTTTITPAAPFNPSGYAKILTITFAGYSGSSTLNDFPALVKLDTGITDFSFDDLLSGNNDIRFVAADGSELSYEIDEWDTNATSFLWVQVPALNAATAIKMYYSKSGVSAPSYRTDGSTWSEGFVATWHMTNKWLTDSSGNGNGATDVREPSTTINAVAGVIGTALQFPGDSVENASLIQTTNIRLRRQTLSAWAWDSGTDASGEWGQYMCKPGVMYFYRYGDSGTVRFETAPWEDIVVAIPAPVYGAWHHIVAVCDGTGDMEGRYMSVYIDGQLKGSRTRTTLADLNDELIRIGAEWENSRKFNGILDELRIASVGRSADWIKAEYDGQNAPRTFGTYVVSSGVLPEPSDVDNFAIARGAAYGQMTLAWSNATIKVLACTNRYYSINPADWFELEPAATSPWTHEAATNFASVYYRIVSGPYTSAYDVGKFDVDIAAGSISWISFPFAPQPACDKLSEWFGQQLVARDYSSYAYPLLQVQNGIGGSVITRSYYIDTFGEYMTNWWPTDDPIVQNAGYVLFLAQDQPAVKLTSLGMVPTNDVALKVPYQTIPWVGLSYPSSVDMRDSGIANLFNPPQKYSLFDYDFVDSQQTLGGSVWYAEYFIDDWGGGTTNFFIDVAGADRIDGGKGYLLFFSTTRTETGTWNYVKPY